MTTIVCNRQMMAADSLVNGGDTKSATLKIVRVPNGILGLAGKVSQYAGLIAWVSGKWTEKHPPKLADVDGLLLTAEGIFLYEDSPTPFKLDAPFEAIGSGAQAAMAAMHLGATPAEAIAVAKKVDPNTGGRVRVLKL